jgi:hypothetical protein
MRVLYLLFVILCIYLLYTFTQPTQPKEKFINSNYKRQKLPYKVKEDIYMNFLGDLNDSFGKHLKEVSKDSTSPIRQKALCDDRVRKEVQSKALNEAFDKVIPKNIDDSVLFDKHIPKISQIPFTLSKHTDRQCPDRASALCDLTDPMLYISQNTRFPPRWIFKPYRDTPLPKHTDLKCWSNMNNCCKNNL